MTDTLPRDRLRPDESPGAQSSASSPPPRQPEDGARSGRGPDDAQRDPSAIDEMVRRGRLNAVLDRMESTIGVNDTLREDTDKAAADVKHLLNDLAAARATLAGDAGVNILAKPEEADGEKPDEENSALASIKQRVKTASQSIKSAGISHFNAATPLGGSLTLLADRDFDFETLADIDLAIITSRKALESVETIKKGLKDIPDTPLIPMADLAGLVGPDYARSNTVSTGKAAENLAALAGTQLSRLSLPLTTGVENQLRGY